MAKVSPENEFNPIEAETRPPFIHRVRIQGYKSIAFCDVTLQPLTILVGRNSSGKSNFLDALAFLRDALAAGTDEAVRLHGGRKSILPRSSRGSLVSFHIESRYKNLHSGEEFLALYSVGFKLPVQSRSVVSFESIKVESVQKRTTFGFHRLGEHVQWNGMNNLMPTSFPAERSTLAVYADSPFFEFTLGLYGSGFYNFSPALMRELRESTPDVFLKRDGRNLASIIRSMDKDDLKRIQVYIKTIVEGIEGFKVVRYGDYETIRFMVRSGGDGKTQSFDAASMSDGTLRSLAALIAAFNVPLLEGPCVVGIEEPETALHPSALRALVDALDEATGRNQIILTTHSAEILADRDIDASQVLIVRNRGGQTQITPVDVASKEIIEKELYSLADLQRQDLLDLDEADLRRQDVLRSGEPGA